MRDDEAGPIVHDMVHRFLDKDFRAGVYRTGGFVQDHQTWIGQNRAGDGDQLLLSLRDVGGLLIDHHVIPVGKGLDEVMDAGGLGGLDHFLISRGQSPVTDVLPDSAVEQPGILQDHAELFPKVTTGKRADIMPVHGDGTGVHVIKAHQEFHHGGLAGSGRSYYRHFLTFAHVHREVLDNRLVFRIAKPHC